jgi:tetratricopeptide (TPR) repeat protein
MNEKPKNTISKGNALMASRNYTEAAEAYSKAIALYPNGAQSSHVYYSNRAAVYCYLERYKEAAQDSVQSLALNPRYGKAYARRDSFYTIMPAPDNAASKSYLAKAQAKLTKQQQQQQEQSR